MGNTDFKDSLTFLLDEIKETLIKKNADYAGSQDTWKTFELSANVLNLSVETTMLVRLLDKVSRIATLLDEGNNPHCESLNDSIQDLIGYSVLLALYHKTNSTKGE